MDDLGYDQTFLGADVAPPGPADGGTDGGAGGAVLEYTHFTVGMHPARRLAWWVAWNIDGLTLYPSDSISRSGERFKLDPRLPTEKQTGESVYADNDLDRGHVARRSDLLWGTTLEEALRANSDSFFFTNITPQRAGFNQSGRGGVWGLLENAVLALDGLTERRLSVFAGPVLTDDDPTYRNLVQLPREFWKVVIYRVADELRFKAFLLTQNLDGIEPLRPDDLEDPFLDDFDTYLVGLDVLEDRTGLMLAALRDVASPAGLRPVSARLVTSVDDIDW
ncbi:DNA/RNA non-specific endonuclease [Nocardioides zeicaulis]|uniref:DNA/RNA non-specific endonuclease n=1 Tax=Nocardioides zeicaulis TaxID=1776857 RepID=A0ABV6E1H2_9ACTN